MPFMMYINSMMNNVSESYSTYNKELSNVDLRNNINKLNIADTLFKSQKIKNIALNDIAFKYLLEDQNMSNNNLFLDTYYKYSTDKTQKNEILKIGNAIQLLKPNFDLPIIKFIDTKGRKVSSDDLITKNTVFYFWSEKSASHLIAVHNKVNEFKKKYPNYNFIGINLNDNNDVWISTLTKYKLDNTNEYKCSNFEEIKSKWAITKIHRTIVMNSDKKIKNAFTNIFNVDFENELK
jgi:peroxiredoxin